MRRAVVLVGGRVQGVGFRWWVHRCARELGLTGHARNLFDGRVEVDVQGEASALDELVLRLREQPTLHSRPGHVTTVAVNAAAPEPDRAGFEVR